MNKLFSSKNLLIGLIISSILILLASYFNRYADGDDGWLGEQAYFLAKDGVVTSEMFSGFNFTDVQILNYHRLLIQIGALFTYVFGLNLYVLKSVSLLSFIGLIFIFHKTLKQQLKQQRLIFLGLLMLISNALLVEFSFVFRPEVLGTLLGFTSFHFLRQSNSSNKIIIGAIFAGLAAYSHLVGLIFIVTGFVFTWKYCGFKKSIIFGVVASLVFSLYVIEIVFPENNWSIFMQQMDFLPQKERTIVDIITSEHLRLFHSPKEIIITVLTILLVLIPLISRKLKMSKDTIYLAILFVSFVLITPGKTFKYLTFLIPFLVFNIVSSYAVLESKLKKWQGHSVGFLFMIYVLINFVSTAQIINRNYPVKAEQATLVNYIKENKENPDTKIGCELIHFYSMIEDFEIRSTINYEYVHRRKNNLIHYPWNQLISDMIKDNCEFVVVTKDFSDSHTHLGLGEEFYKAFETDQNTIYKGL